MCQITKQSSSVDIGIQQYLGFTKVCGLSGRSKAHTPCCTSETVKNHPTPGCHDLSVIDEFPQTSQYTGPPIAGFA